MEPSLLKSITPLPCAPPRLQAVREAVARAAYGAFLIPKSFGTSISLTGGAEAALIGFIVFYVFCTALTWFYYSRKSAPVPC